jgi:SynChlorMet cassette protein ScmD
VLPDTNKHIANPLVVLREEFDDWAVLFNPDTSDGFSLNPVGVFIWKLLDNSHTMEDILKKLKEEFKDMPKEGEEDLKDFIKSLVEQGLAGYEIKKG